MRLYLTLIISVLLLIACNRSPDPTPASPPQIRVTVTEALVFEIPTREAEVVFRLIEGDQLPILAQTPPDLLGVVWYQILQGSSFGWVAGSQVAVSGDLAQARKVSESIWDATPTPLSIEDIPPTQTPSATPRPRLQSESAPLLDSPNGTQIDELQQDQILDLLGQTADEPVFYLVGQNQQVLGWVAAEHISANTEEVPVITSTELRIPVTLIPTQTPNLVGTAQLAPTATDLPTTPTLLPNEAMIGIGVDPPFELPLPEGWQAANISVPLQSDYLMGNLPVSIYQGEVAPEVMGTIWVFWGFPNVTRPSGEINLYADGVQLLRGVLFDQTCNIGLGDSQFSYEVGGYQAIGSIYAAVDCAETADIAGFFGVLQLGNGANYAFFGGIEPPDKVNEWLPSLQNMLKSLVFKAEEN